MLSPFSGRWAFLAFGFACAFFSSFGQTSFIAVFGGALRAEFGLTNGEFGALYSLGTLASGLLVAKVGGFIDEVPLRRYAAAAVIGLGLAALAMSVAVNFIMVAVAIFLLRLFGQGLMSHIAATSMAREFTQARGRAISIATLGHPAGESLFPAFGALMLSLLYWRGAWMISAAICFVVVLPLALALLRPGQASAPVAQQKSFGSLRFLRRPEMLLALPAFVAGGFISTGLVFHQVLISEAKNWAPALFASSFAVFGTTSIIANLVFGWLVDRFGARHLAPFYLVPLGVGCFLLSVANAPWALFCYMAGAGMANAGYGTITTSLLAEYYGTERLGSIRATTASVAVLSTSLSPLLLGVLFDFGVGVNAIAAGLGMVAVAAALMMSASELTRGPRKIRS